MTSREVALCRQYGMHAATPRGLLALYIQRVRRMRAQLGTQQSLASGEPDAPRVPRSWAAVGV